jgi:hypothetical protein
LGRVDFVYLCGERLKTFWSLPTYLKQGTLTEVENQVL